MGASPLFRPSVRRPILGAPLTIPRRSYAHPHRPGVPHAHGRPPLHSQAAPATPSAPHWGSAPAVFPPGARMAALSGDPAKSAPFTVELALPAGHKTPPHLHPTPDTATANQGPLLLRTRHPLHAS